MLEISQIPQSNSKKYYLLSAGLAIVLHLSLVIFLSQALGSNYGQANNLSIKLIGLNANILSLENKANELPRTAPSSQKADLMQAESNESSEIVNKPKNAPKNEQKLDLKSKKSNSNKTNSNKTSELALKSSATSVQNMASSQNTAKSENKALKSENSENALSLSANANTANMPISQMGINRSAKIDFQRGVYPQASRLRGEEGTCVLLLTISPEAQIIKAELEESSNYPRLDKAALQYALDPKAKHKIEVALLNGLAIEAQIIVNVHFRLER